MASAIGAALISTILPPMAAKAMAICEYVADEAVDKVMDKPKDKAMIMAADKVDGIVNIERDISKLQTTLCMIQDIVRVAEEKQIDDVFIGNWLRDLVDIGYEARDVLDDFITFFSCPITGEETSNPVNSICSLTILNQLKERFDEMTKNLVNTISSLMLCSVSCFGVDTPKLPLATLNQLEKDIRCVRERFDEKNKEAETFRITISAVGGGGSKGVRVEPRLEVGPSINRDSLFLGREEVKEGIIMEKILNPSDDNRVDVVVIWGMGGIGKTTLARSIYNDESVKKVPRKWLCVGEREFCAEKVIMKIIGDSSTNDAESLQEKLAKELMGNRFLIVLDGVWDVDGSEWDLLFDPLTKIGKGGLILITRRERQLCDEITIQTAYNLEPLSEEDSWSIFESCAYVNGKSDSTPDLKCIGEHIVKKLNGHPLALKVVGRSLLNKDYSTWTDFLESKFSEDDEVMFALRWSYNHLPRHLKTCFTYCALFPKDHVLDKKVLVEMWMAHDLIEKEEQECPEDVGAQYFEQLVNASLLQCVDGKHMMHDLIHDLALLVSNGEFANANSSLTDDQMKKVRHITITSNDYSKMEKLLTLYDMDKRLDKFFLLTHNDILKLKSIRVLVLSSECIYKIPDCINEFKHLRYLDVSKTRVKSLPDSLCHLYNLQMLAAPLDAQLPRDIVNMANLRHLRANLSTCKGVGKLTSLQELSSIRVCQADNIKELGDMQRLHGKLTIEDLENVKKLEDTAATLMEKQTLMDELELVFNQHSAESIISDEEILDALGCPPNLTYLQIAGYNGLKPPSWMVDGNHKFEKLQTLELLNFPKLESLPPLGELTSLKDLHLKRVGVKILADEFYGKFTDGKVFFPSLESLSFADMEEWEEWDDIIIENSSMSFFPNLTELELICCPKLVSALPTRLNVVDFMKSLSSLKIDECAKLISCLPVVKKWEDDEHPIMKRLQPYALVSLKKLEIKRCSSLVHITLPIFEGLEISSCRLLEKMDVTRFDSQDVIKILKLEDCESLRSLSIDIHGLDSVEYLRITGCPKLELAFEDGSSSSSSSGNSVAVPIHNIHIDGTQVFRTLLRHELVSLKSLKIGNLEGFENFDETEANNFCKSRLLKSLYIWKCKDLKSLPVDFHKLSSLKDLNISDCPQLQSLPPDFDKLSSLKKLTIIGCVKLQSLPPDFGKLSSLKKLMIIGCVKLQSLPPDFNKLSSLKHLIIVACLLFKSLPPDFHKISSLEYLHINSSLLFESLPPDFHKLSSLKNLMILGCPQLQSLPPDFHKLSSLKYLEITSCPLLQSLPPHFHKLSSLEKLNIDDCPQLQSLPTDGFPPSIRRLSIIGCPLLYERCRDESGPDRHKINHIPWKDIRP